MKALSALSAEVRQYLLVTGNYWAFTLTDGALRMLVVLHFHALGYTPLQIAALFLFYEIFGVVTNLVGGYLGARTAIRGGSAGRHGQVEPLRQQQQARNAQTKAHGRRALATQLGDQAHQHGQRPVQ